MSALKRSQGFTILEALIAIFIFGLTLVVVIQTMVPIFRTTKEVQTQAELLRQAQNTLEAVRAAWNDPTAYKKSCAEITIPPNIKVTVAAVYADGTLGPEKPLATDCATAPDDPAPIKRVTVTATYDNREITRLILEMPAPK